MSDYITLKEYAEIRGCSLPAVYKRLTTTLTPYLTVINGKIVLNIKVLEDEKLTRVNNPEITPNITINNPTSSNFFERQIEEKDKQNERLNKQIEELQESNKKKDDYIQEQGRKLTELLEQSNILLQNNQILLSDKTTETKEEVTEVTPRAVDVEEQPQEKKSWFKRLFG